MKPTRWRTARILLVLSCGALLAILVWQHDPAALLASVRQLSRRLLIVLVFPFTLVNTLDTLGWRFAFRGDQVRSPRCSQRLRDRLALGRPECIFVRPPQS